MIWYIGNILNGRPRRLENIDLNALCNVIILISAVIIAGKNIYAFFKKPVDVLQEHTNLKEEEHIEEVIQRKVPELLTEHWNSVDSIRKQEEQKRSDEVKSSIISAFDDKIEELKEISLDQGIQITQMQKSIDLLSNSQLDMMRYNMNRIYYKYRAYKKILDCDKKAFIKLYDDYKPMGGNSWIDSLYPEVMSWETVENVDELKVDK